MCTVEILTTKEMVYSVKKLSANIFSTRIHNVVNKGVRKLCKDLKLENYVSAWKVNSFCFPFRQIVNERVSSPLNGKPFEFIICKFKPRHYCASQNYNCKIKVKSRRQNYLLSLYFVKQVRNPSFSLHFVIWRPSISV